MFRGNLFSWHSLTIWGSTSYMYYSKVYMLAIFLACAIQENKTGVGICAAIWLPMGGGTIDPPLDARVEIYPLSLYRNQVIGYLSLDRCCFKSWSVINRQWIEGGVSVSGWFSSEPSWGSVDSLFTCHVMVYGPRRHITVWPPYFLSTRYSKWATEEWPSWVLYRQQNHPQNTSGWWVVIWAPTKVFYIS